MKQERQRQGLTQQQLADLSYVSLDTIKRYESGKSDGLRLDMAYYIAKGLGVPIQTLLPPQDDDPRQRLKEAQAAIQSVLDELNKTK